MGKTLKKYSNFLSWMLVPSLLLFASVFGVNFISKPGIGIAIPTCSVDVDCNSIDRFNSCRVFQCVNSVCENVGRSPQPSCQQCAICGNGVCEPNTLNTSLNEFSTCDGGGQDCNGLAVSCFNKVGPTFCDGTSLDFCCPAACNGNPADSLFDIDCGCCGNSFVNAGETCDPPSTSTCDATCQSIPLCGNSILDPGESCDGTIASGAPDPTNCQATCRVGTAQDCTCCGDGVIQSADGEQCDPPNGTTCNASCQIITPPPLPVCGNGILEAGEACEGTTCSVTVPEDGTVVPGICQACQCFPQCTVEGSGCGDTASTSAPCVVGTGGTATGVASLLPVHSTVLAQWIAAFAVPGTVFTGLRMRRKKK